LQENQKQNQIALVFNEKYYENAPIHDLVYGHFEKIAIYIRDVLKPRRGVIDFGGGQGYIGKYLDQMGINNVCVDISQYCLENKVCTNFAQTLNQINFNNYDWLITWGGVWCCIDRTIFDDLIALVNTFKGEQLHLICCDNSMSAPHYKRQGYILNSHEFYMKTLPDANLVCWDHMTVLQGSYRNIPIWDKVSD